MIVYYIGIWLAWQLDCCGMNSCQKGSNDYDAFDNAMDNCNQSQRYTIDNLSQRYTIEDTGVSS